MLGIVACIHRDCLLVTLSVEVAALGLLWQRSWLSSTPSMVPDSCPGPAEVSGSGLLPWMSQTHVWTLRGPGSGLLPQRSQTQAWIPRGPGSSLLPWRSKTHALWVLRTEPRTPKRETSTLYHWAISPAPLYIFKNIYVFVCDCMCGYV